MNGYTLTDIVQRSEEWHAARRGRVSGSVRAAQLIGNEMTFRKLACRIAIERLGMSAEDEYETPDNDDIRRGVDQEPEAFQHYVVSSALDWDQDEIVKDAFVIGEDDLTCCSPDLLILSGQFGAEFKAPRLINHMMHSEYGLDAIYKERLIQCQWYMFIFEWDKWDFVSYHRGDDGNQSVIIPIYRDDKIQIEFRKRMKLLRCEVNNIMGKRNGF